MVVELTGARLLAPTFGSSVVPWTAVIASVLTGIALGNVWGGRRSQSGGARLLRALLAASAALVLLPLVRLDLPDVLFRSLGSVLGGLASSLVLLLPAAFLLGASGPLLVRIGTSSLGEVGRRSGSLSGANAGGAILGTILTGFVLVPLFPVSAILLSTSFVLAGAALLVHNAVVPFERP